MPRLLAPGLCAAALLAALVGPPQPAPTAAPDERPEWDAPLATAGLTGVASCSAQSCHGGAGRPGTQGAEYTTWGDHDPHRNAHRALYKPESRQMVERLAARGRPRVPAHADTLCLKCHGANTPNGPDVRSVSVVSHRDGVGCEGCHGAGERYLTAHYQPGWRALSARVKAEQYGFANTDDLAARAVGCAGCHVGRPDAEVDHDLIAAGHPALRFESAAYHQPPIYTRHWRETGYAADFEVRNWLVGQIAAARAAAELTRHRAELAEAGKRPAWPELSEFGCYGCHQTLTPADAPARRSAARLGGLAWGAWQAPMVRRLAGAGVAPAGGRDYESLFTLMQDGGEPPEAAAAARSAVKELGRWLTAASAESRSPMSAAQVRALMAAAARRDKSWPRGADWEGHAQRYLAVAALHMGLRQMEPAGRAPADPAVLRGLAARLRFPDKTDGPARFDPEALEKMWTQLAPAGGRTP